MGSAIAGMNGKRPSPSVTRSISSNSPKTWQPSHGIIFKDVSAPGSPRLLSTAAMADHEQNLELNSHVEENYLLANSHVQDSKTQKVATVAPEETPKSEGTTEFIQEIADNIQEEAEAEKKEPPISRSAYSINPGLLMQAKKAAPETPGSFWSHTLYRGPEVNGVRKKVQVHYCRSLQTTERVLKQYFEGKPVLGFDIEWKAEARSTDAPKKNVSLIQLATEERVGLFHLALYPTKEASGLVAPTLKKIMEDPEVTKVGVAICADCTRLRKYLDIDSVSLLELSHLHRLVKYTLSGERDMINKKLVSLAKQTEEHLQLPLYKGNGVRSSDWSRELSIKQIKYAASDSYAGFHIYNVLEMKRQALDPVPPRPCYAEQNQTLAQRKSTPSKKPTPDLLPLDSEFSPQDPTPTLETSPEAATKIETKTKTKEKGPAPDTLPFNSDPSFQAPNPSFTIRTELTTVVNDLSLSEKTSVLLAAEVLVAFYRKANPKSNLSPRNLRTYFVWYHNYNFSPRQLASVFVDNRNTSVATTARQILSAISIGGLPFEHHRLRSLLQHVPKSETWDKYRGLVQAVDMQRN
ncbi:hypothetical protein NHQ30_003410 [Ciborinia camelliae]|nr:hypothetical protein NHQ30_003410 [Ciborinia camelliae]